MVARQARRSATSAAAATTSHERNARSAGAGAVALHVWKGNDLVSIFGATALYMLLVQTVFA